MEGKKNRNRKRRRRRRKGKKRRGVGEESAAERDDIPPDTNRLPSHTHRFPLLLLFNLKKRGTCKMYCGEALAVLVLSNHPSAIYLLCFAFFSSFRQKDDSESFSLVDIHDSRRSPPADE